MIDPFGLPARIDALERTLAQEGSAAERLSALVELAWYLRQRDTTRALRLVDEAERLIAPGGKTAEQARLLLVKGDSARLLGNLDQAERFLAEALDGFRAIGDRVGEGDALVCDADRLAMIGEMKAALAQSTNAIRLFTQADDPLRIHAATLWSIGLQSTSDGRAARERLKRLTEAPPGNCDHPAVMALAAYMEAWLASQRSDYVAAITGGTSALAHAEAAELRFLQINLMYQIGSAYENLGDHTTALDWKERGYALARPTGWPEAIGYGLASMAHTKGQMTHQPDVREMFQAALKELSKLPASRRYAVTCSIYASSLLAAGDTQEALEWFHKAASLAAERRHRDAEMHALTGCARTLNTLNRPSDAQPYLARALVIARERDDPMHQVYVLHPMAKTKLLLSGREVDGCLEAIQMMEEAVQIGRGIPGYIVRSDLFADLAAAYEVLGDFRTALSYERQSRAAWEQEFNRETSQKLAALQVRFETQRAREDAEHMKKLAQAEAERAMALDRSNQTLELLSTIGREITASLDADAVFATLYHRLGALVAAPSISIGLMDDSGQRLDIQFRIEEGQLLPPDSVPLDDPRSDAARAVRDRRELDIPPVPTRDGRSLEELPWRGGMFHCPLQVGERVLGVLSIQHHGPGQFGPREQQIVRSVASYAAVALANARAYRSLDEALATLQDAQGRLVQQEKLASLGQLVAGVAHEVNTPIGILLSLSSLLVDEVERLTRQLNAQQLKRTDLVNHLQMADETARLMMANASRAADLVSAFKQVAADRTHDEARTVDLVDYVREVAATVQPLLRPRNITLTIEGEPGLRMTTFPGLLAQVITNLVQNAVTHAFNGIATPVISITVGPQTGRPDEVGVEIADNGIGMTAGVRAKAFEPFFTTRRSSGGTGLGLHVVHNVVTGPLQGRIDLITAPDQGCRFILQLPRAVHSAEPGSAAAEAFALPTP